MASYIPSHSCTLFGCNSFNSFPIDINSVSSSSHNKQSNFVTELLSGNLERLPVKNQERRGQRSVAGRKSPPWLWDEGRTATIDFCILLLCVDLPVTLPCVNHEL